MFTENNKNCMNSDFFLFKSGNNYSCPKHIHRCFEIITVTDGEMSVSIDGKEYRLKKYSAVLVFPNQVHSFHTVNYSSHTLCRFSPELIQHFSRAFIAQTPESNIFETNDQVFTLFCGMTNDNNIYSVKGILYLLCGEFLKTNKFFGEDKDPAEKSLLYKIFDFICLHFKEECSLSALSKALDYDYSYLSKFFSTNVGISYNDYVTQLRLAEACYMLKNTNRSIKDISAACGFMTLRSFNRNFKNYYKIIPADYRNNKEIADVQKQPVL